MRRFARGLLQSLWTDETNVLYLNETEGSAKTEMRFWFQPAKYRTVSTLEQKVEHTKWNLQQQNEPDLVVFLHSP